jgi:phosphoribosylanthranilate isomerase
MRVRIKVCGITTPDAAAAAAELGVDAAGFVFATSPRRVDAGEALHLAQYLSPLVTTVAVFRHPRVEEITKVMSTFRPNVVQTERTPVLADAVTGHAALLPVFHDGPDIGERVARYASSSRAATILLEAPGRGGRGVAPDWERATGLARTVRLVLAGGLTPENVGEAIRTVCPYAVDVSSGVESEPGIKDPRRMEEFVAAVRTAQAQLTTGAEISP